MVVGWLWTNLLWTLVECYLGIMCASAPALKPLYVRYIAPEFRSAYNRAGTASSHLTANITHRRRSLSYQGRSWKGSKKASNNLSSVELGIVVKSEIDQVVVVEMDRNDKGHRSRDLGSQGAVPETWGRNSEASTSEDRNPVQSLQSTWPLK